MTGEPVRYGRCAVCNGVTGPPKGVTYLAARQQWVKIGRTDGPVHRRIKKLSSRVPQVLCPEAMDLTAPLRLAHVIDHDVEHALHWRFARYHVIGEWFLAKPVLDALGVT